MILDWIKRFGMREAIKELDLLKPYVAGKLKDAQKTLASIPPEEFADNLVTEIQTELCTKFGVDPKDVGIKGA